MSALDSCNIKLSAIAAIGINNEIGVNGELLWHCPEDLKIFKEFTMGKVLICGRKTYDSMPELKGRTVCVVSDTIKSCDLHCGDVTMATTVSPQELLVTLNGVFGGKELVVIGGTSVYKSFAKLVTNLQLTHINRKFPEADTFFPIERYRNVMSVSKVTHIFDDNVSSNYGTHNLKVGTRLCTKDGRVIGNAVLSSRLPDDRYTIITDFGNKIEMNSSDIVKHFYPINDMDGMDDTDRLKNWIIDRSILINVPKS